MIKTLRITSVVAAVLAVVFFVFPAVFGVRSDEEVEQYLDSPGVIEKFNKAKGDMDKRGESQISPLVKEAQAFALYLNPLPLKKKEAPPPRRKVTTPRPPAPVSPKFKLIGVSYYASHPELSLALIDEPGRGTRWVRQSSRVSHLIIEQVKDGLVVVRDGERTFELVPARLPKRSLLESPSSGKTPSKTVLPVSTEARADITSSRPPQVSAEESAAWEKLMDELKAIEVDVEPGKTDSEIKELIAEKTEVLIEKYVSDLEAMRISAEEAKRLDDLGKELKAVQRDPNRADDDITESDADLSEPNLSDANLGGANLGEANSPEEE